jgi:hypothetical protein
MKYRILLDRDKCYPQKKRFFFWKFYPGHPYYPRRYTFDLNTALDIIEEEGINTEKTPVIIQRGDAYKSKLVENAPTIGAYCIAGIILLFFILLKKTGMF